MSIIRYFFQGCRAAVSSRAAVLVIYCAVTLIALVPAVSFRSAMNAALGSSVSAEALVSRFDFQVVGDLLRNHGKELSASLGGLLAVIVLSACVNLFFSGGIISAASTGETSLREFLRSCGEYVGRLVRVMLLIAAIALVTLIGTVILLALVDGAMTGGASSEDALFWTIGVDVLVAGVLLVILSLIDDYARIALVVDDEPSAFRSLKKSVAFVWSSKFAAAGLTLLIVLAWVVLSLIYLAIEWGIGSSAATAVIGLIIFQQLLVAARVVLRIAGLGAETRLYQDRRNVMRGAMEDPGMGVIIDID